VTPTVVRLETTAELAGESSGGREISVSARLDAVLPDGRRVVLLDDRGWTTSGPADLWSRTSADEIERTARVVVGPDEPPPGRSPEAEAALHWDFLAGILRAGGIVVDGVALARLQHDVVLGKGLRARLAR
jgi:hypothetical protein